MKSSLSSASALLALCVLTSLSAVAQGPSTGGPAPGTPAATTDVPLDGGASLLLAGGVAYGLRRLRARRQARQAAK